ncbi:MAG: hypothetical protein ACYCUM_01910 [Solirubrobacteraceae bacterium]
MSAEKPRPERRPSRPSPGRRPPPRLGAALAACGCVLTLGGAVPGAFARARRRAGPTPAVGAAARARGSHPPAGAVSGRSVSVEASPTAKLHASFEPYRLGRRTTLQFEFAFSTAASAVPPPLVQMQLRYPRGLNLFLNNLGIRRCPESELQSAGPSGCPRDSVMGYGVVRTGIVLGDTPVEESSPITILRAPERDGHLALLFFAEGTHPVLTNVIFSGLLLSAQEPFGGRVRIGVPLVETLPGAPYVSVLHLHATIGPERLTYYRTVGGVSLAFRPKGILLPPACPRHSFPFAANFVFSNGAQARASTVVACPPAGSVQSTPRRAQANRRARSRAGSR